MNGVLQSWSLESGVWTFLGKRIGKGRCGSHGCSHTQTHTCPTLITDLELPIFAKVCRVLLLVPCVQACSTPHAL